MCSVSTLLFLNGVIMPFCLSTYVTGLSTVFSMSNIIPVLSSRREMPTSSVWMESTRQIWTRPRSNSFRATAHLHQMAALRSMVKSSKVGTPWLLWVESLHYLTYQVIEVKNCYFMLFYYLYQYHATFTLLPTTILVFLLLRVPNLTLTLTLWKGWVKDKCPCDTGQRFMKLVSHWQLL